MPTACGGIGDFPRGLGEAGAVVGLDEAVGWRNDP